LLALVDGALYVSAAVRYVFPPRVPTCKPVLSPALVDVTLYRAVAVLCVDMFFDSACGSVL